MDTRQTGEPPEYYTTRHDERIAEWVNQLAQMCSDIRDEANDDEDLGIIEDELFSALSRIEKRLNVEAKWRKKKGRANG